MGRGNMATYRPAAVPKPIEVDTFLGLNESVGDTEVKVGEAIYMLNYRITPNKKLEKRGGHTTFVDQSYSNKAIQGMWYGTIGGVLSLIYANNGNIKRNRMPSGVVDTLGTMTDAKTKIFYFQGKVYFQNGSQYKYYDGTTFGDVTAIAYVPTVAVGSPPAGGGTAFEEINLLTGKKKQKFVGNGSATVYQLTETAVNSIDSVTVNGVTASFTANTSLGQATITPAPANLSDVVIQWTKTATSNPSLVLNNRSSVIFGPGNDTTVFMWGDPSNKNRRTFSATLDPTYFPVSNFTYVGSDEQAITDMQPQYNRLIIFKESETFYSQPEYIATLNRYDYPVFNLNYSVGNVCFDGVQVVNNNPVSLYGQSVWQWVNTSIADERNATDISIRMPKSFENINFANAVTYDNQAQKELWINVDGMVYIWNYQNDTWYIYDNVNANCFVTVGDVVYYGSKDGKIERFEGKLNDNDVAIVCKWKSGFMDMGAYEYVKNSPDMWLSIQPATRTSVNIKCPTNRKNEDDPSIKTFTRGYKLFDFENIDFEDFSFDTNRNPQTFRIKIKAKKYAYIQFILSNSEPDETLVVLSFKVLTETNNFVK
jgi:hypothetical protein